MIAYRLCKTKYAATALSGYGAKEYGGRWNSRGVSLVYLSGSIALATLEVMVHVPNQNLLSDLYSILPLEFPKTACENLDPNALPNHWTDYPAPDDLQQIGNQWVEFGSTPLLRIPSAIIPSEFNYLFNPNHNNAAFIQPLEPREFYFDSRLTT